MNKTMPCGMTRPQIYDTAPSAERKTHWAWRAELGRYKPDQYRKSEEFLNTRSKRLSLEHKVWLLKRELAKLIEHVAN